ncbi:uncharacterized protein [Embiotoca jacksoni]|uniref:uncharacterized protein n=1 Tax=Embiotoca jacksoni TaxID=100190 RepID=UPI003704B66B
MTSEEEEGPGVSTSIATTSSAATISRVTTAVARCDSGDAVTSSSSCRPSPYHRPCPKKKEAKEEEIEEEGVIQEERIEREEEVECEGDDEDDDDDDDGSSDTSVLVVPYPELVPVVFFCLKQTTFPRSWCIRMVTSPYPLNCMRMMTVKIFRISAVRYSCTAALYTRPGAHTLRVVTPLKQSVDMTERELKPSTKRNGS